MSKVQLCVTRNSTNSSKTKLDTTYKDFLKVMRKLFYMAGYYKVYDTSMWKKNTTFIIGKKNQVKYVSGYMKCRFFEKGQLTLIFSKNSE